MSVRLKSNHNHNVSVLLLITLDSKKSNVSSNTDMHFYRIHVRDKLIVLLSMKNDMLAKLSRTFITVSFDFRTTKSAKLHTHRVTHT